MEFNEKNGNKFKITNATGVSPYPLINCLFDRIKVTFDNIELFKITFATENIAKSIKKMSDKFEEVQPVVQPFVQQEVQKVQTLFTKSIIANSHLNTYEVGDFFKCALVGSLKYVPSSKNPIKSGTETVTRGLSLNSLKNFMNLNVFFNKILNDETTEYVKTSLIEAILQFIEVNGDNFCITRIMFPEGMTNVNPAPFGRNIGIEKGVLYNYDNTNKPQIYASTNDSKLSYDELNTILNAGIKENYDSLIRRNVGEPIVDVQRKKIKNDHKRDDDAFKLNNKDKDETEKRQLTRERKKRQRLDEIGNYIPIPKPLSWADFKKYFENYIVNFTTDDQHCLKIITFLKMMRLDKIMRERGWGFIDIAGGSLFNFLQPDFVVTADYDFKIYFNDVDISMEELQQRETYIKLCAINLGINLNNLMMSNNFFKSCQINGIFGFINFDNEIKELDYLFEITPASGRYFSSRGKEPDLFPVPLYSSDVFFSVFLFSSTSGYHSSVKLNVSYEDLVFKHVSKHYLYMFFNKQSDAEVNFTELVEKTYHVPYRRFPFLSIRVPSLWEIKKDVGSLLIIPKMTLERTFIGKANKDRIRKKITEGISKTLYDSYVLKDTCPPMKFEQGLCENGKMLQIIKTSDGSNNSSGYFQTRLFELNTDKIDVIIQTIEHSIANVFNPICKLHWYVLALIRKYSEFKNKTDYDRLSTYKNVYFKNNTDFLIHVFETKTYKTKPTAIINDYVGCGSLLNEKYEITIDISEELYVNQPILNKILVKNGDEINDPTIGRIISKMTNSNIDPLDSFQGSDALERETGLAAANLFEHTKLAIQRMRAGGGSTATNKRLKHTLKKRYLKVKKSTRRKNRKYKKKSHKKRKTNKLNKTR